MVSLVQTLSAKPVSKVDFDGNRISLHYDGKHLSYRVRKRNTCFVGNWSRSSKEIFYDAHLKEKLEVEAICIHEAIEKYVTEKYSLDVDSQSHRIAQAIEKRWFQTHKKSWKYFDRKVTRIWKIHGEC